MSRLTTALLKDSLTDAKLFSNNPNCMRLGIDTIGVLLGMRHGDFSPMTGFTIST